jgi:HlyD family secretion protein
MNLALPTQRLTLGPVGLLLFAGLLLAISGCGNGAPSADAYGNFEATEVRVAAELGGRLLDFPVDEGQRLEAGATVGRIETTALELEKAQLEASRQASASRTASVDAQLKVLEEQRRFAASELRRAEELAADGAATPQQLDRARSEVAVLAAQIRQAATQRKTIADEVTALDANLSRLDDRIARAGLVNPVAGTVLTVYAQPQELVAAGQPLYDIADLSALELRAYASGAQLPEISLGQEVEVAVDAAGGGERRLKGEISWIATTAEFTPSTLQTKEERVDLVYAFKVRVANPDGRLKIGMPGEVYLRPRVEG